MERELKISPTDDTAEIANKVQNAVADITQMGMAFSAIHERKKGPRSGGLAAMSYVGCMSAAGALVAVAMAMANKPHLERHEIEERGEEESRKLVNQETMLFAALVTTKIMVNVDPKTGAAEWEWSPEHLYEALQDWEKITGKSADGILDAKMLEAAREWPTTAAVPLAEFLGKRSKAIRPSDTIQ